MGPSRERQAMAGSSSATSAPLVPGMKAKDPVASLKGFLGFRILNALVVVTFFQPDEYFQALEPAWQLAFGQNSAAWITWEWRQHLRSSIHPALFAIVYKACDLVARSLSLSLYYRAELILVGPPLFQAVIAAAVDYHTHKLAQKTYGEKSIPAWASIVLCLLSPWQFFCSTRTFSNCLETALTVMALNAWPWEWMTLPEGDVGTPDGAGQKSVVYRLRQALLYAALATVLRPTNVLIWMTLAIYTILQAFKSPRAEKTGQKASPAAHLVLYNESAWSKLLILLRESVVCGCAVLALSAVVDRVFYGCWTFPPLNFLHFNVVQSLAVFYGNNNWHYYLSEGYPLLTTVILPFTLVGMYQVVSSSASFKQLPTYTRTILFGLALPCITLPAALSVLAHKEVRFISPILPPLLIVTALPVSNYFSPTYSEETKSYEESSFRRSLKKYEAFALFLLAVVIAGYTVRHHNSGTIAVTDYLRHQFESLQAADWQDHRDKNMTVAFLMPCHSTPWRSHLQYPPTQHLAGIQAWALTCEPPLHLSNATEKRDYKDEADIFYENPKVWLRQNMARHLPGSIGRKKQPGVYSSDQGHRNRKIWDLTAETHSSQQDGTGLDITDLLPHLMTHPPSTHVSDKDISPATKLQHTKALGKRPWPKYIAFFAQLEPIMQSVTRESDYTECWRHFNSHWHDDWRRRGDVIVYCLPGKHGDGTDNLENFPTRGTDEIEASNARF